VLRGIFVSEEKKIQHDVDNYIVKSFTICNLHHTLEGHQPNILERLDMQHTKFWSENLL